VLSLWHDKKRNSLLNRVCIPRATVQLVMLGAVQILPLSGLPLIKPGDDLSRLMVESARRLGWGIREKDVLVVGQKAVSKAEGRLVDIASVRPSKRAMVIARKTGRKPGFVQIVLNDSKKVVRADKMALIVTTKHGWTCLNAGVDKSNVKGDQNYALLPTNPDASARRIRSRIRRLTGKEIGVIVTDTHSRPFRLGQVEETIGIAGLKPHADYRGQRDLFGYQLRFKNVALADEVAGAAELVMGQGREAIPAAIVRGLKRVRFQDIARSSDLTGPARDDLFKGTL
jgi:coenzyme F420-0:L-glutamate ligase / coenzyme F420-1:gamma-L-glutamate ligase